MPRVLPPGRTRTVLLGLAAAVATQTALHLLNRAFLGSEALDVNEERTVFAYGQALVILAAGVAALVTAGRHPSLRLVAVPLGALLAFLALDEAARVHERVAWRVQQVLGLGQAWDSVLWPAVYLPLTGAVFLLALALVRGAPRTTARLVHAGLVCLVLAVVLEVLSAPFSTPETADGLVHALEGAVEEGLELGGWGLIGVGAARRARRGTHESGAVHPAAADGRGTPAGLVRR